MRAAAALRRATAVVPSPRPTRSRRRHDSATSRAPIRSGRFWDNREAWARRVPYPAYLPQSITNWPAIRPVDRLWSRPSAPGFSTYTQWPVADSDTDTILGNTLCSIRLRASSAVREIHKDGLLTVFHALHLCRTWYDHVGGVGVAGWVHPLAGRLGIGGPIGSGRRRGEDEKCSGDQRSANPRCTYLRHDRQASGRNDLDRSLAANRRRQIPWVNNCATSGRVALLTGGLHCVPTPLQRQGRLSASLRDGSPPLTRSLYARRAVPMGQAGSQSPVCSPPPSRANHGPRHAKSASNHVPTDELRAGPERDHTLRTAANYPQVTA